MLWEAILFFLQILSYVKDYYSLYMGKIKSVKTLDIAVFDRLGWVRIQNAEPSK